KRCFPGYLAHDRYGPWGTGHLFDDPRQMAYQRGTCRFCGLNIFGRLFPYRSLCLPLVGSRVRGVCPCFGGIHVSKENCMRSILILTALILLSSCRAKKIEKTEIKRSDTLIVKKEVIKAPVLSQTLTFLEICDTITGLPRSVEY